MMEKVNKNHIRQVPTKISLDDVENIDLMFNTSQAHSVLSEYQLSGIREVREHNYDACNEYNLNGEIISEEEIVGNRHFYVGFYTDIAYLQLRVCYHNNMLTIVRYRSADKDADNGDWNSDITFIIHHNGEIVKNAKVNQAFKCLMEKAEEYEWCVLRGFKMYDSLVIIEEDEEIIEDLEELEEVI